MALGKNEVTYLVTNGNRSAWSWRGWVQMAGDIGQGINIFSYNGAAPVYGRLGSWQYVGSLHNGGLFSLMADGSTGYIPAISTPVFGASAATAAATARRARTPTRWARYSALAWMSLLRPLGGIDSPSSDFTPKRFFSASSNAATRKTPFAPAPVTANTLISPRRKRPHR